MSTLRQRLKEAKELLSKTYDTTIRYYDLNSDWVKDFKKERESWFN